MNRAVFLTSYIFIALALSGGLASPLVITVMALTYGREGPIGLLSPVFLISVFSPIVLIVFARMRGKRIGMPKLVWFPVAALAMTFLPLLIGLLAQRFISGSGSVQLGDSIGAYAMMSIATASTLAPLILHTICCVVGGKRDPVSVISTATK